MIIMILIIIIDIIIMIIIIIISTISHIIHHSALALTDVSTAARGAMSPNMHFTIIII
jgi:hypothetical protein